MNRAGSNVIDEIAAAWAARMDGGPLNDEDELALDKWVQSDSRHPGALARAMAINIHFDKTAALGTDYVPEDASRITQFARHSSLFGRRQALIGGSALALTAMLGGGAFFAFREQQKFSTAKGVIQRQPLADGSSMILNTATDVRLSFDQNARKVELLGGEARFDVVKDAARPFLVLADDITVRAIGTSFAVWRQSEDSLRVVVSEGVVEVLRGGATLASQLTGGHMIEVASGAVARPIALTEAALNRASAWTSGLIDMDGLSLQEAAAEFGRYSEVQIELQDPSVANERVSGVYSINNPLGFARDAALSLGLDAVETGGAILIRRK